MPFSASHNQTVNDINFWQNMLVNGPSTCAPRGDYWRDEVGTHALCEQNFRFDGGLFDNINKVAKSDGLVTTLFLGTLAICLQKLSQSADVTIGIPAQKAKENENTAQALPLRTPIDGNISFKSFLGQLHKSLLDFHHHDAFKVEDLINKLAWQVGEGRYPLFDVAFSYSEFHASLPAINNDISFVFRKAPRHFKMKIRYKKGLYRDETIEMIAHQYRTLLQNALGGPDQNIATIALQDRDNILHYTNQWNDTARAFPDTETIMQVLERKARFHHDIPALVYRDQTLSYGDMLERAIYISRHLRKIGIKTGEIIGVCLKNPLEATLAFLGISRAGAAFLPLDPNYPDDRLSYMIEDSGCQKIIADTDLGTRLDLKNIIFLPMDNFGEIGAADLPQVCALSDDLAYVIYTSGSTGKPKGTLLEHRGLCNLVMAQARAFDIEQGSRVLQFASLSFDAAISEIFVTLCNGATLCLGQREDLAPVDPLINLLKSQRITHVTLPPSLLAVLPDIELPDLRVLITAGESCPPALAQKWSKDRVFLNAYGPTENTVCASISHYNGHGKPLIGKPIDNNKIHILDENMNPVPIGACGEIYIDSAALARGYHNRIDLTNERFVANPFNIAHTNRLYRTGDLGRWQSNGEVEFFGRIDHQIKLRGFRIELDEISHCLCGLDNVENAIALAIKDSRDDQQIIAFLSGHNIDPTQLRSQVLAHLPDYMCPSDFVILDSLPQTPNGKIDRNKLARSYNEDQKGGDKKLPRDEIELSLLLIWRDLLDRPTLGIEDDFFANGGHSLLAVRLLSRIEREFSRKLQLDEIFAHSTVEGFAKILRNRQKGAQTDWSPLVPLRPAKSKESTMSPLFCIHPAGGRTLCYLPLVQNLTNDIPVFGLQARGFDAGQVPFDTLEDMAKTYASAILAACPNGPYRLMGWSGGGIIAFKVASLLEEAGKTIDALFLMDAYAPDCLPDSLTNLSDPERVKSLLGSELIADDGAHIDSLSGDQLIDYLRDRLIEAEIVPPELQHEDIARFFDVYKSNCLLAHSAPRAKLNGATILFKAAEEKKLHQQYSHNDGSLGWSALCDKPLNICEAAGNHNSMMEAPFVAGLVEQINPLLK